MSKLIHITDVYQPHNDPDDHYDLAQIFALQKMGDVEVQQVIIDYPKQDDVWKPAFSAVHQLNKLTGRDVKAIVGANVHKFAGKPELWKGAESEEIRAAELILEILNESSEKVYINIAGGCLDTAIALTRRPEIFHEKCAGIFLNAGSAVPTVEKEWNVTLGAREYAKIFDAPCPVFWNPCMHSMEQYSGMYGTYYRFEQKDLWKDISPRLIKYFLYALSRTENPRYLEYLDETADEAVERCFADKYREMYCTAGLFAIAGKCVECDGSIVSKEKSENPVFSYRPICVKATVTGETEWEFDEKSNDRFIFSVNDTEKYDTAMTKALASILAAI